MSSEIMGAVLFLLAVGGAIGGMYWKWGAAIGKVRDDLAAHKLHVAEQYITKAGMRETTEQIMDAIHGVKQAVDHMTVRVDRIVENQAKPRATRAG